MTQSMENKTIKIQLEMHDCHVIYSIYTGWAKNAPSANHSGMTCTLLRGKLEELIQA